ncbi:MAG: hypothetical protein LUC99_06045 [Clostridiales bacterium]|nr:hypothetical protein [Clostridiales bacterium]
MRHTMIIPFCVAVAAFLLTACGSRSGEAESTAQESTAVEAEAVPETDEEAEGRAYIEYTLNLANNEEQTWSYERDSDAWVLSIVPAVAYPELPDQQGVSVCVPGAYVTGIDTDGDGTADITAMNYAEAAMGSLVIDYETKITSPNGQTYTAATAPVILNTGAAGYGSSINSTASTTYAEDGYINVACGNRGKQDTATDADGNTYYTGDAPSCLVDQKAATRFVKYNILLGNLPGSVDHFVSTGGSGGGAHATMFAATSNHPDFYDYEIAAGAVGVYKTADGGYSTTVTIDGTDYEISDGAWGCIAYSAITSLYEGDMAMAFEYYLDTDYTFNTPFQKQLASYLSIAYMDYINDQELSVKESEVGFDLNQDGDLDDVIDLRIEYDPESHPETNGYYGTYLDLYLAEFTENLQWYIDSLDYASDWTWFDENGSALSDEAVAAMSTADKAQAFLTGRYAKGASAGRAMMGGMGGGPNGMGGGHGGMGGGPGGAMPDHMESPSGTAMDGMGAPNGAGSPDGVENRGNGGPGGDHGTAGGRQGGDTMIVGTPDEGTTQSATSRTDSANYETYADMVSAYREDIEEIEAGDAYGKNLVSLYHPLNYIGAEGMEDPTWSRILMGAAEGDMSMFTSLNLQLAWLDAGTDAEIAWQWDGGHVPSEVLGDSFSLYVDEMYGKHENGSTITKAAATPQTENGTAGEASGTDISGWVQMNDAGQVSFTLADAAAYRTAGASKAIPGFDVIDYGQEDYVFGNRERDARHWNRCLLEIFEAHEEELAPLFNAGE